MKTRIIIAIIGAGVVYVLTVAIALDQVATKTKECAEWKRKYEAVNDGFKKMTRLAERQNDTVRNVSQETIDKLQKLQDGLPQVIAEAKIQGRLEALNENLERLAKSEATSDASSSTRITNPSRPSLPYIPTPPAAQVDIAPAENAYWKTYQGIGVLKKIRADAEEHWGTDYKMVEFQIKGQKEAFETLLGYRRIYDRVTKGIVAEAENHWGTDYKMVVYQIKEQIEAKSRLDRR